MFSRPGGSRKKMLAYLLFSFMKGRQSSAEAGHIEITGIKTHVSGRQSDQETVWVWSAQCVTHMSADGLQEVPFVVLVVHHHLEGVAGLPEVLSLPAHDGHQVGAGEGEGGHGGGAHHTGVTVLLVLDINQPPHC